MAKRLYGKGPLPYRMRFLSGNVLRTNTRFCKRVADVKRCVSVQMKIVTKRIRIYQDVSALDDAAKLSRDVEYTVVLSTDATLFPNMQEICEMLDEAWPLIDVDVVTPRMLRRMIEVRWSMAPGTLDACKSCFKSCIKIVVKRKLQAVCEKRRKVLSRGIKHAHAHVLFDHFFTRWV